MEEKTEKAIRLNDRYVIAFGSIMYDKRNKMENIYLMLFRAFLLSSVFLPLTFHLKGHFALQYHQRQSFPAIKSRLLLRNISSHLSLIYQRIPSIYSSMRVIRRSEDINLNQSFPARRVTPRACCWGRYSTSSMKQFGAVLSKKLSL